MPSIRTRCKDKKTNAMIKEDAKKSSWEKVSILKTIVFRTGRIKVIVQGRSKIILRPAC